MWVSRYWLGGLLTMMLLDGINYLMYYDEEDNPNRFNNKERVVVFLIWPFVLSVFVVTFIYNFVTRKNKNK